MNDSPADLITSIAIAGLVLAALCWGTIKILITQSVPWKNRILWALLSLTPLIAFVLVHRFQQRIFASGTYWFRDNANPLPLFAIVGLNQWIRHIFGRRFLSRRSEQQ